jgi:hypothetical protein
MKNVDNPVYLLPPREENTFRGARQFMHRWDFFKSREAPSARGLMRTDVKVSPVGNINIGGTNRASLSMIFVASQDGFFDAIEPCVRNLVRFFAVDLDFITYTSCEGHHYRDRGEADERHVGILPRDDIERAAIWNGFVEASTEWNQRCADLPIAVGFMDGTVRDDSALLPTVDIYLTKRPDATWDSYFIAIDLATVILIDILSCCHRSGFFDIARQTKKRATQTPTGTEAMKYRTI